MQKILKWTHKASFPLKQDSVVSGNTLNIKAVFLLLSSVITILIPKSMAQLPDNGFRNRDYNDDLYNSGGSFGGSQTILEVVKSINYLSEVRKVLPIILVLTVFTFLSVKTGYHKMNQYKIRLLVSHHSSSNTKSIQAHPSVSRTCESPRTHLRCLDMVRLVG